MALVTRKGRTVRIQLVASVTALLAVGAGCDCDTGRAAVYWESFEDACGEMPCGWEQVEGRAQRVSTYHAGEHGLRLERGAIVSTVPDGVFLEPYDPLARQEDEVYVAVQCQEGASLEFRVEIEVPGGLEVLTGTFIPLVYDPHSIDVWRGRLVATGGGAWSSAARVLVIEVEQFGEGTCVIDDLRILTGELEHCGYG
jgi:hypothetical protein